MFTPLTIITIVLAYMACLFSIALWVEKKSMAGTDIGNNAVIYSLSLSVYCTSWTFFGSVGMAATSGMLFSAVYLGPTLAILTWFTSLRRMIRLKNRYKISTIADLVAARYNKSRSVAAVTTLIALIGVAPYVALQLKSVNATFAVITGSKSGSASESVALLMVVLMIVFTIIFGVRRLDATERHQGIMVVLAVECLVKLLAFLAVGIFVCYFVFDGMGEILSRVDEVGSISAFQGSSKISYYMLWTTHLVLSMSAILFLPRQFHVAVVENFDENHVRTAMWLFPLYLLLITFFVFPIAVAGLLSGLPASNADTFVLSLPINSGNQFLSLTVFVGGFSAATGMVMISSMTMATMATNHLVLPLIDWLPRLHRLRRYLLQIRWVAVTAYIFTGYLFNLFIGESFMLANMGMISFAAVLQFVPAIVGGLFWPKGNKVGALCGLSTGFILWFYTLLMPAFVKSGWLAESLLVDGPFGLSLLRPESLLGLGDFDPMSHAVFWTMLINGGSYILASLIFDRGNANYRGAASAKSGHAGESKTSDLDLDTRIGEIEQLLMQYFYEAKARRIVRKALGSVDLEGKKKLSVLELVKFYSEVERELAGSIGSAAAYHAIHKKIGLESWEEQELSREYAKILTDLRLNPDDLKSRVDFYQERHQLLLKQASELGEKVEELNREIGERRQAERALQESESKYHTLVDNLNVGVYRIDRQGFYVHSNPAMARIFGFSSVEELMPINIINLYQKPEDRAQVLKLLQQQGMTRDKELAMKKHDGTPIWCSVTATVTYDQHGEIAWIDGVLEDVTEKKKLEDQLRQAQKMEAIGTLAGGVAHDFNNILTALIGYGNLLKLKLPKDNVLHNYVDQILNSSDKATNLTKSLLAFSRKQAISPKPVDLNEIVGNIRKLLGRVIGEDIDFHTSLAHRDLIIMADSSQIEQVLLNLATNSRDAMPNGGILSISTEYHDSTSTHDASQKAGEHTWAVLTVSDTGVGMGDDIRQRIFEPFYTTKEVGKGTGLGLSIVYGIVKQHGGDIHVYSEPGRGTSFKISLPMINSATHTEEPAVQELPQGGHETVLIAEDSTDVRTLMVTILKQFGYTVIEAIDGQDAVAKYLEHGQYIDALILDVIMPKMNGREALNRIKALNPKVKAIFSSGYTADIIQRQGIMEEGIGFLQKPVLPHVLLGVLRKTLDTP